MDLLGEMDCRDAKIGAVLGKGCGAGGAGEP